MLRLSLILAAVLAAAALALASAASAANERPLLVSFSARFYPELFATIYTAYARDPEGKVVTVGFTFRPPANDPRCRKFEEDPDVPQRSGRSFTQRATWYHGDQHGCNHQREGAYGHDGFVTVRFGNLFWSCNATYRGSLTSRQGARPHVFCARIERP